MDDDVIQLDTTWRQLICLYFLSYRAAVPRWLLSLTFRFDTLGEFLVVAHGLIGFLAVLAGLGGSRASGCVFASIASAVLWLSLRRAARAHGMALHAARLALRGFHPPIFQLHPRRFFARRLMTLAGYLLHDLRLTLMLGGYVSALGYSAVSLEGGLRALLFLFYAVGAWCLAVLARDFSEPPCLLYLSNSGEFPDSRILSIRESAYPARVLTLVRQEKPRVGLAYRTAYLRVAPSWWAALVWKTVVRLQIVACGLVLLDFGEGDSENLAFEIAEIESRQRPYLSIGRADSMTHEDLTFTGMLYFLRKQSSTHVGSIYGPRGY